MAEKKESYRLFIATFFENEALNLVKPLESLDEQTLLGLKRVLPEKVHLTWKFIGDFPVEKIPNLMDEVDITAKSIQNASINMTEIKIWPNKRKPRQIVIASDEDNPVFNTFFNNLEDRLLKFDIAKESRRFNPHITIARFRKNTGYLNSVLNLQEFFTNQKLYIKHVKVVQSILSSKGPEYKIL